MKQKHSFILVEVFIAIALLSLCAFPLITASFKSYQFQKEQLFALELERQAELHFYRILKESVGTLTFDALPSKPSIRTALSDLDLRVGKVNKTHYPHYHLYSHRTSKSPTHKKIFCSICFPTKRESCSHSKKNCQKKNGYTFCFLVKKVVENEAERHLIH